MEQTLNCYIVDFDGTVTVTDSLVRVFDEFCIGDWWDVEHEMRAGKITRTESLMGEVDLMRVDEKNLFEFLKKDMKVRDGFGDFVKRVQDNGDRVIILSGGFNTFICAILKNAGVDAEALEIIANDIASTGENTWKFIPSDNPLEPLCDNCPNCKRAVVEKIKNDGFKTVYIGDGETDFCASVHADRIFAIDELKESLEKQNVSFEKFCDFNDIE
jgi:2,3-diketo-5-methylthio-1-phosphopentane phosphatase